MNKVRLIAAVCVCVLASEFACAERLPFTGFVVPDAQVFVEQATLEIEFDSGFEETKIQIPRLHNVVQQIRWKDDPSIRVSVRPEPEYWLVAMPKVLPESRTLQLILDAVPRVSGPVVLVQPDSKGVISLRAQDATTSGSKLRFEPQPHKNTVGYWTQVKDTAGWNCSVPTAQEFDIEILQGCGRGQGGSDVVLKVAEQELSFRVLDTGHFQNFRWRHLGRLSLPAVSNLKVQLIPRTKAKGAVMDCREIRLTPAARPELRRTGTDVGDPPQKSSQASRPNVLFILTDDQGTLDAGCYGSRDLFTPRLDGLAKDGIRFTRAYSHTVCCPARAMLMTGRHPQRSGINSWTQRTPEGPRTVNMSSEEVTIAEALKTAGYRTCLSGKWHLGAAADAGPTTQGFDQFFGIRAGFIDNFNHYFLHNDGYHDLYRGTQEVWRRGDYFPDLVVADACRFLTESVEQHADQPFFLYLALNIPHYPEQAIRKFDQAYVKAKEPRRSYGQMVSTTDDYIGKVLDELDRLGVRDNTIVVYQSDNGHSEEEYSIRGKQHSSGLPEGLRYGAQGGGGNTGRWIGCKSTFFEGGLRVPSIVSFPQQLPSGEVRDQAITLCDWMPTILDLCDVALPDSVKLDGASLLPVLKQNADSHHTVLHWQWKDDWCVTEGDWKLISSRKGMRALYSLKGDEPERQNFADQRPEMVERLTKLHEDWLNEVTPAEASHAAGGHGAVKSP